MKTHHKFAIVIGFFFLGAIPGLFWLGGYNFDKRGETAVLLAITTLFVSVGCAVFAATFPD
jgi:hypothetical protein